jgi:hypothetical protein
MKKLFVCLANSRKYSGRCIAGIELVEGSDGHLHIVRNPENNPKWIRPVSQNEFGELYNDWVRHIRLGDLIEIDMATSINLYGHQFQSENIPFQPDSMAVKAHLTLNPERLSKIAINDKTPLFGCRRTAIPTERAVSLGRSLQCIRVQNAQLHWRDELGRRPQERLRFSYNDTEYDLPMTDIEFLEKYLLDEKILEKANDVYLTVSLGLPFGGKMYKLAAGIFVT